MSLHDHFTKEPHPGFTRSLDPSSARRQFQVSLGLAIALAIGIGGSAFALRPAPAYDVHSQRAKITDTDAVNRHPIDARVIVSRPAGG